MTPAERGKSDWHRTERVKETERALRARTGQRFAGAEAGQVGDTHVLTVWVKDLSETESAALHREHGAKSWLRIESTVRSWADLLAAQARVAEVQPSLVDPTVVAYTMPSARDNQLVVALRQEDEDAANKLRSAAPEGTVKIIIEGGDYREQDDRGEFPPMKAGRDSSSKTAAT